LSLFNIDNSKISFENFNKPIDYEIKINSPEPIFPRIDQ